MLPDFPKMRKLLEEAIHYQIHLRARTKSVISTLVHGITQHEGTQHSYHQEGSGTITQGYEQIASPFTIRFDEVPELIGERLEAKIDALAEDIARQTSDLFYKTMDEVTKKAGTSFDGGGGPITQEIALEMHERTQWSPDSVFIAHPVMAEAMSKKWNEWQADAEFMKKFKEIDRRKKEEWRDRESNRKLVN